MMDNIVLETERLVLRELTPDDLDALYAILSDPESMRHYPAPFSRERVEGWIAWNLENYKTYGFGLWAVIRKADGLFLGDCGITMQLIAGRYEHEIGYHINRAYTGMGYATEAARACKRYAFDTLGLTDVYTYQKYTNMASRRVAEKNGMRLIAELPDEKNTITTVYRITRSEYDAQSANA